MTFEYAFDRNYLDLDGLRYHYIDEGPRDADTEAVVMVHGNPSWSYLYRNLVPRLTDRFRTIVPDHIGCGHSDKPNDARYQYTLARRVSDLGALIDGLNLAKVHLVVHDWGGMIGTTWAVQNPDRVLSLTAMNTGAFHLPNAKPLPFTIGLARTPGLGALMVRGLSAFSKGANRYCVTRAPMRREVAAGFLEPYDSWRNRIAVHRFVQDIPLNSGHPTWDLVSQTQDTLERLKDVPMLFCWGMRDFVFDRHFLAEWVRRFPHATVHRFDDAGHYLLEDAGEEVFPLVRGFLLDHAVNSRVSR